MALAVSAAKGAERYQVEELPSRHTRGNRTVRVYLPPSYLSETNRHYPVLYLHDGQNVFSFAGTNIAFGWGSWELDKTADRLVSEGRMREVILVGIDNSPDRFAEYGGSHRLPGAATNTSFENYEAFLIDELKPHIDQKLRTLPEPASTGVMGSSLGGICSVVLAWDRPDVFGGAASLSGAFHVNTNFLAMLRATPGKSRPTRLYFDSGAVDYTGGDDGRRLTAVVAGEFQRLGWKENLRLYVDAQPMTSDELAKTGLRRDKWAEAHTSQHNEFYWRQRAWRALSFLFPPEPR
jgi:predicted alpha/beta superfamily hydrolase